MQRRMQREVVLLVLLDRRLWATMQRCPVAMRVIVMARVIPPAMMTTMMLRTFSMWMKQRAAVSKMTAGPVRRAQRIMTMENNKIDLMYYSALSGLLALMSVGRSRSR